MNQKQLDQIKDDFTLSLTKEYVKQGRSFTSILESSEKYGKQQAYWKLSGKNITKKDLEDRKLKGSGTLKKIGKYKHTFQLARNNKRTENTTLNVAYFADKNYNYLVASENIELIAKSYDPDDDPNEPWKLTSTRIDSIKENVAVRAQISNGKPGKKVFFQLSGNGLDKNDLDLSYGRMKGKAKMDENGYAVIPFMIRADHKTEGTETFEFSFFKDKKFNKKYSSFSLNILDESVETTENSPTLSPKPARKQPVWSGPTDKGTWFTIAPSRTVIQENQSSRTRINSDSKKGNKLHFKITGDGIDENDFDLNYARTAGKIKINNSGTAFIPQLLRNDNNTEGTENMTISLYRDKKYKELVATSTVPISDTSIETPEFPPTLSPVPTSKQPTWGGGVVGGSWFTLSPGRAEYNRGEEIGVRIDSDSLPGTKLVWRLSGENISADAIEPSEKHSGFSGKQTIGLNGISQFNLTFKPDNQTEDDSEITFELYREDDVNTILAKTSLILAATPAEAKPNKTKIDEGKEMKFKIFTKGLAEGETVYWDLTGENITEGDFETPISGSTILDSTRKFQVRFGTRKDLLTEGTEYFRFNIYSDEAKSNLMDSSGEVTIFDTSIAIPAEAIPNKIQIDEGKKMKFKISTKGLAEGDTVYWDLTGENMTEGDFETPISGSATLDSTRKFQVGFEARKDLSTEGPEYFRLNMYSNEAKSDLMGYSERVTIFDTSTAIPAEAIPNKTQIDEGKEMKFKIFTKGLAEGDTVYWDLSGQNITDGDFETPISGSTTLDSTRKFQIHFHAKNDSLTEGTEDFQLNIYTDISKSKLIASSKEIGILDKSTTPIKIYNVESNYSAVQRGKGFKMKVKTKNIPNDDIIYWKGYGSAVDRNIVELENSNSMNGIIPLDSKGNSVLQFRTNNQDFYQPGLTEFKFGLYENENFLQPISNQVEVLILN